MSTRATTDNRGESRRCQPGLLRIIGETAEAERNNRAERVGNYERALSKVGETDFKGRGLQLCLALSHCLLVVRVHSRDRSKSSLVTAGSLHRKPARLSPQSPSPPGGLPPPPQGDTGPTPLCSQHRPHRLNPRLPLSSLSPHRLSRLDSSPRQKRERSKSPTYGSLWDEEM